jgi:MtN3 and saliva related transmembrane protein
MDSWAAYVGMCAAFLSSLSYIPQVRKAWPRGSTDDLSLTMLVVLTSGLSLWIAYGVMRGDWVIIAANGVGASLSGLVLAFKVRDSLGWSDTGSSDRSSANCRDSL